MPDPAPEFESVADRLAKLEQALAALQADRGGRSANGPAAGPFAAALVPAPAAAVVRALLPAAGGPPAGGFWARVPVLAELRLMVLMWLDPRYRLTLAAQFGAPAVGLLMVASYVFFNHLFGVPFVPLVSVVCERLVLAVLSVVLYKILAREAARYAAVLDYLARYHR